MKKTILFYCLLCGSLSSCCQEFSKSAFFFGVGYCLSENSKTDGLGFNYTIGYQRDIWRNRLRITPSLSFGAYNGEADDAPDAYFSSTNLKCDVNFDLIKIKTFSLFIGTGLTANYSSGLIGTGGDPGRSTSTYFNETNLALNGLVGLRLNPINHGIRYELALLNASIETRDDFSEITVLQIRIIVKVTKPIGRKRDNSAK
jgi:hypothetical protein